MAKAKKKKFKDTYFYQDMARLKSELKNMTFKQKVDHLWTYYKEYFLLALPILVIIVGLIASSISANRDTVICGIMVNVTADQKGYNYLSVDYEDALDLKGNQEVRLEYTSFDDLATSTDTERNYTAAMTVIAEVSAKTLDYMILDGLSMQFYSTQEVYGNLSTIFSEEELAYFDENDMLVYCQEEEQEEPWPAAVKIDELPFVKAYIGSDDSVFFALSGSSEKLEQCRAMWDYINAWEAPAE